MCDSWKLKLRIHRCEDQSCEVIIVHKDEEQLNICGTCWTKIVEKCKVEPDIEYEVPKPLFGCN